MTYFRSVTTISRSDASDFFTSTDGTAYAAEKDSFRNAKTSAPGFIYLGFTEDSVTFTITRHELWTTQDAWAAFNTSNSLSATCLSKMQTFNTAHSITSAAVNTVVTTADLTADEQAAVTAKGL